MIYLSGVTNDRIEPAMIAGGVGLMVQPGNSYHLRTARYAYWAADNGCFEPKTYIGDDAWLTWLDRLPREGCLFAVVPDVARRPDGSLGGDPEATWAKFQALGPLVREMGFPAALAAQDGIETMPNLREQIEACDCLFLGGSTKWKIGPGAAEVGRLARSLGRWVHMGRTNSGSRVIKAARVMGCLSVDGTYLKYALRKRAGESEVPDSRGVAEIVHWMALLDATVPLPGFSTFETPSNPLHRKAAV